MDNIVYCPTCSKSVSINAQFCPNCGERYGHPFDNNVSELRQLLTERKWILHFVIAFGVGWFLVTMCEFIF